MITRREAVMYSTRSRAAVIAADAPADPPERRLPINWRSTMDRHRPGEEDAAALEFAAMICTEKQMEVLYLRAKGMGLRQISRRLLIHQSTARDRLDSADLRLRRAIEKGAEA